MLDFCFLLHTIRFLMLMERKPRVCVFFCGLWRGITSGVKFVVKNNRHCKLRKLRIYIIIGVNADKKYEQEE